MKRLYKVFIDIFHWIGLVLLAGLFLFIIVRFIGQEKYAETPPGGINESMFVDINGTQQWISIYGENINNPVLLYLHGGPGSATSPYDYAFTRKWADVYTVVTWDQRNCGKSYSKAQNDTELTYDLFMSDGLAMTKYICEYMDVDKITILGHSWGTYFGSNLVLTYPEYYDLYIGTGQMVDFQKNEEAFHEQATLWAEGDSEGQALVDKLSIGDYSMDYYSARSELMNRYGYDMMVSGTDYNMVKAIVYNPYYSIGDLLHYQFSDYSVYMNFIASDEFAKFSLLGKTEYEVPYININGDRDYQTNFNIAQEYFDSVEAPYKKMYMMPNMTHGLLESKSEDFSVILHEIAEREQ